MYGGALRGRAEIGTQALRIWGARRVFILKGWMEADARRPSRAGRRTHLALPGIREHRLLVLPETNQHRVLESYTPSSPESKTAVTGERVSWRVLVLERRRDSDGPTGVETGSEGGRRRVHRLPGRDFVPPPCTTFRTMDA